MSGLYRAKRPNPSIIGAKEAVRSLQERSWWVLWLKQYLTGPDQGRESRCRGGLQAKESKSVLHLHRQSERRNLTAGKRISRREIGMRRESRRELSDEK